MKRLLKLSVVAVMLVLGVSSCLKEDDSLSFQTSNAYILQVGDKFIPQMRVESWDLKSASLKVEGEDFNFKSVIEPASTTPSSLWELPRSSMFEDLGLDSISSSVCTLTLTGIDEKVETRTMAFAPTTKRLGDISASLEYSSADKEVTVTLSDTVENAKEYYLMIQRPISENSSVYTMWMAYTSLEDIKGKTLSEEVDFSGFYPGVYRIAVAAAYTTVVRVDENSSRLITIVEEK